MNVIKIPFQVRHKKSGVIMARKLVHLEVKPSVRAQILKGISLVVDLIDTNFLSIFIQLTLMFSCV